MKSDSLVSSNHMKAGLVTLQPGEAVGEHVTENREEVLIVLSGTPTLIKENKIIVLKEHETHYIAEGVLHNVRNNTNKELQYVYVVSLEK
ncbi:MAG: cupin domain-containing protein [Candidatus Aenigmarchaeota archaeon]|nr:cupin domain-containing protein [Candidatus Aenigmarchaeota archaeon]